jgi:hypothetical protein
MYKAPHTNGAAFAEIKSYVGNMAAQAPKGKKKKSFAEEYNVHHHPPPLILHRLKFRVFYPENKKKPNRERNTQRGGSEVKQTAHRKEKYIRSFFF